MLILLRTGKSKFLLGETLSWLTIIMHFKGFGCDLLWKWFFLEKLDSRHLLQKAWEIQNHWNGMRFILLSYCGIVKLAVDLHLKQSCFSVHLSFFKTHYFQIQACWKELAWFSVLEMCLLRELLLSVCVWDAWAPSLHCGWISGKATLALEQKCLLHTPRESVSLCSCVQNS